MLYSVLRFVISTRTPHAGSDTNEATRDMALDEFQPALPMRGVTTLNSRTYVDRFDFNPHSPCGE